ncbi:MAG: hypothetical protein H0W21_00520, partial [Actinobacteria bacterium]|nr:hypothetical protein [Actinomycetota bacterium]
MIVRLRLVVGEILNQYVLPGRAAERFAVDHIARSDARRLIDSGGHVDVGDDVGAHAAGGHVAASALVRRGAGVALVTAGGAGTAVDGSAGAWWIEAPAVKVVNPIGAGDAFVGGFCGALERGAAV